MIRHVHAGVLSLVVALSAVAIVWPPASLGAGVAALIAGGIGLTLVRGAPRVIALVLAAAGIAALVVGAAHGRVPTLPEALAVNQDLVGMLAAVSFLRLLALGARSPRTRLSGRAAVARTALVVHSLGAVINISAVALAGDQLARSGPLRLADGMLLTRAYAAGAFWSPFWVAAAAAISYVPGADARVTVGLGLAVALVAVLVSVIDVSRALGTDLERYRGYAVSAALLRIPLALVAFVLALHLWLPDVPIPRIVLLGAILVTVVGIVASSGAAGLARVGRHAIDGVSSLRSETTLFVAAGVMTVGLQTLVPLIDVALPVAAYSAWIAWASIVVMVLDPDPTLFVLAATIGWGASAAIGPTSGILMHVSARFGLDAFVLALRNAPFFIVTLLAALPALLVAEAIG